MSLAIKEKEVSEKDIIEYVEEILKDWKIYQLIINDEDSSKKEKYKEAKHIIKCIEERSQYLNQKECTYLEMKYFKKKSYQEIAKRLKVTPRTLSNWRIKILYRIAKRGGLI